MPETRIFDCEIHSWMTSGNFLEQCNTCLLHLIIPNALLVGLTPKKMEITKYVSITRSAGFLTS